jgi:Autotransporter beta-domain
MCAVRKWKTVAVAAAVLATVTAGMTSRAQASPAGCAGFQGSYTNGVHTSGSVTSTGFRAGDTITLTVTTAGVGYQLGLADETSLTSLVAQTASNWTYTVPADTPDLFSLIGNGNLSSFSWSCSAGVVGTTSQSISQNIVNAQVAVANGQQTLKTMNDWISKGVMGTFTAGAGSGPRADASGAPLTARARLQRLVEEEQALAEERSERTDSDGDLDRRLGDTRRNLKFARLATAITPTQEEQAAARYSLKALPTEDPATSSGAPTGDAPISKAPMPSISASARDLVDYCGGPDVCDGLDPKKWNAWLEARVISANDSLAQSNGIGFVGTAGVDYKVLPWLATGVAVSAESFNTSFGTLGLGTGSKGLSAAPYVGIRLQDNVFVSVFAGLTALNYNSTPATGVSAQFGSLRLFAGGALTGVWRDGPWRFQPTLAGTYASEQQYGYTDSSGTVVSSMTVNYGRVSAGPEIGYTIFRSDDWTVEPFVLARANLDFTSSNVAALNGVSVTLRPGTQGSGSAGGGFQLRSTSGLTFRVEGSYESIGVVGLDVWTGLLRGTMSF